MVSIIKKLLPKRIKTGIKHRIMMFHVFLIQRNHNKQKQILRRKVEKGLQINVAFFVIHESIWKYEELYKLLLEDDRFKPVIVVVPEVIEGKVNMDTYFQTFSFFTNGDYELVTVYDERNNHWNKIESLFNPEIIFFTNPHKITFEKYYIHHFQNKLTCYTPYAFVVIHSLEMHYKQPFYFKIWKYFLETPIHKNYALEYLENTNNKLVVTGFPGLDSIYRSNYQPKKVWKDSNNKKTRIIWAPHHTINGQGQGLDYSNFIKYHKFFVELTQIRDDIQIAFKPHPLLKNKLYNYECWGKRKTDEYYQFWQLNPNGQLETGQYIDLFHESDAMIMDSASFLAEYQFFDKPLLFTLSDEDVKNRFNSFGRSIFDIVYEGSSVADIINFIDKTVICNKDIKRSSRKKFQEQYLGIKQNLIASEKIYNELLNELIR